MVFWLIGIGLFIWVLLGYCAAIMATYIIPKFNNTTSRLTFMVIGGPGVWFIWLGTVLSETPKLSARVRAFFDNDLTDFVMPTFGLIGLACVYLYIGYRFGYIPLH